MLPPDDGVEPHALAAPSRLPRPTYPPLPVTPDPLETQEKLAGVRTGENCPEAVLGEVEAFWNAWKEAFGSVLPMGTGTGTGTGAAPPLDPGLAAEEGVEPKYRDRGDADGRANG